MVKIHSRRSHRLSGRSLLLCCCSIDTLVGYLLGITLFLLLHSASQSSDRPTSGAVVIAGQKTQQQQRQTTAKTAMTSDTTKPTTTTIAYAVSVTGCGGKDPLTEGAAVLRHSIQTRATTSHYDAQLFAIVHPEAMDCAAGPLTRLGYTVLERPTPVAVEEIRGEFLREKISSNGCCGEKELIKLEAYTLTEFPLVVHLDLDVLVLRPLDTVFDLLLGRRGSSSSELENVVMWKNQLPGDDTKGALQAAFTMDYNMARPSAQYKPVQGGFLVIRPSMDVYREFQEIVREGDFRSSSGWGGKVGPFYGSMTFQGIIPYYYNVLHPGQSIELNRCVYNQMCDNPRTERTVNDVVHGDCRTGEQDCQDCRSVPLETVVTTHFTLCQKPWWCLAHDQDAIQHRLCRKLTHAWYEVRSDLERSWGRSPYGSGNFQKEQFFGFCSKSGEHGYQRIAEPYGKTAALT